MTRRVSRSGLWRLFQGKSRWFASWAIASLLLLCSGCSFSFAYRHADWLIMWQLNHYFDITPAQRHDLSGRLPPLLTRHRREALPQYEAVLVEVQQRFSRGLASEDIDWAYATYDRLRADLFERVVPDGGAFLASIDSRQVQKLERVFSRDNRKAIRVVESPVSERLEKRAKKTLDWLSDWIGSMSAEQRADVHTRSLALPDTQPAWMANQLYRQQELLTLLHQPRSPESVSRELRAMLVYHDQTAPPTYRESAMCMRKAVKDMVLAVDHQLTVDQRRSALAKLQTLIDQLHNLQAD